MTPPRDPGHSKRKKPYDRHRWTRPEPRAGVVSYACARGQCRACARLTCSHGCHTKEKETRR